MFRTIGFIFRWLPVIITAVNTVEQLVSPDVPGESKKTLVVSIITDVLRGLGVNVTESYADVISSAIDTVVAVLNALGIFRHAEDVFDEVVEDDGPVEVVSVGEFEARVEAAIESDEALNEFLDRTAHLDV